MRPTANAFKNIVSQVEANLKESCSASQDTLSIASYMQSQADYNYILEEDEIVIRETSNADKFHQCYQIESENCKLFIQDLDQGYLLNAKTAKYFVM